METTTTLPRETALLVVLLEQLQRQWALQGDLEAVWSQLVRLGVSAAPSAVFRAAADAPVEVRGLAIGGKLFVHVVAADAAVRLDLVLSEYTKQQGAPGADVDPRTHSRVGQWLVSTELLQWRLERNVFPVFDGAAQRAHVATSAGAELGRLPEPLLLRIAPFLSGKEYCGMTQTNKFLHEYADKQEIWKDYVAKEFPSASTTADEAASKALYVKCHEREKRRVDAIRSVWASLPPPPPHVPLIDPFARPSPLYGRPPLNGSMRPPDMPRPPLFDF